MIYLTHNGKYLIHNNKYLVVGGSTPIPPTGGDFTQDYSQDFKK